MSEPDSSPLVRGYGIWVALGLFVGFIVGVRIHQVTGGTFVGGLFGGLVAALASWFGAQARRRREQGQAKSGDQSTPPGQ